MNEIKLNLGCGNDIRDGYINIDFKEDDGVDMLVDLNECELPFKDESVDEILLFHTLEHLVYRDAFIEECHRVLKPDGTILVKLPVNWSELGHQYIHHRKDYFYTVCNESMPSGGQGRKLFDLVYQKRRLTDIWHLIYRFRDWFLNLFSDEWEYKLKKVKK